MKRSYSIATLLLFAASALTAQEKRAKGGGQPYPPELPGAKVEVYKTVGDTKLNIYIYEPEGHKAGDQRPGIVFFFGGGWSGGSPKQFEQHCKYLASRGMVAMAADYRVATRHQVKAVSCVEDAKSAIRWVRQNAKRLGVDPKRLAAGGGSAGGHLAACTGVLREFDAAGEDKSLSSAPNAMVLFNPAVVLAPIEGQSAEDNERVARLEDRMGVEPKKLSPYHNVAKGAPPCIVFHGKADTTVPYSTAEAFAQAMTKAGSRCELEGAEGQAHGFFNYGRGDNKYFTETVKKMDAFLVSLGYLKGENTVEKFMAALK
ncbi:MAG: alpha/beta hydrolase fold domain-containing protein [Verrucomicrobiota bacterium]